MKKRFKSCLNYFALLTFIAIGGCSTYTPEPFVPVEWSPKCDSTLKMVWRKPINPDTTFGEMRLFYEKGRYIFKYLSTLNDDGFSTAGFFNFRNQQFNKLWEIKEDTSKGYYLFYGSLSDEFHVHQDKFAFTDGRSVIGVNDQGNFLWKFNPRNINKGQSWFYLSGFSNKVYYPSIASNFDEDSYLFEVDMDTGDERLLFIEVFKDNYYAGIDPPVVYKMGEDTIATFQSRKLSLTTNKYRTDMIAWNVSKGDTLWRIDSVDRYAGGSANPIIFENNKLYYAGAFDIYCLDAFTGKMIWRQSFDNYYYHFNSTDLLLLLENGLVVKSLANEMALLDKETGEILWENRGVGSNCHQLTAYKGDIYALSFGDGWLECIDSRSGLLKWRAKSPYCIKANFGMNDFVIDPTTNLLYISDNYFLYCFQLEGYD